MEKLEGGVYKITSKFVESMLEWFKNGKTLPRRYVWEIVLGCYKELIKEESLTDMMLEQGVTCDVIGDLHGNLLSRLLRRLIDGLNVQDSITICCTCCL